MQRHRLFSEIPCIAAEITPQRHRSMQRHTFSEQKTCVAKSERKACDRYENEYKNANEYKNERTGTRNRNWNEKK